MSAETTQEMNVLKAEIHRVDAEYDAAMVQYYIKRAHELRAEAVTKHTGGMLREVALFVRRDIPTGIAALVHWFGDAFSAARRQRVAD